MPHGRHLSTQELELYHLGRLEAALLASREEHLSRCQDCRDRLGAVEVFIKRVRAGVIRGKFEVERIRE